MRTNHLKKFTSNDTLFIHIPKAAGMTITTQLYGEEVGHYPAKDWKACDKKMFSKIYKFTIARNPVSRVCSAYNFLSKGGMEHHKYDLRFKREVIDNFSNINEFVINYLNEKTKYSYIHFYPQTFFLLDDKGDLLVDEIYKVEELDEAIMSLNKRGLNLSNKLINTTGLPSVVDTLSPEAYKKIIDIYKDDYKLLGYDF